MIDRYLTNFQEKVIYHSNKFVHRDAGPYSGSLGFQSLGRFENRIVMSLGIGMTDLIDYVKLPLAAIEELTTGILLTPTIPFSGSKKCFKHYKYAFGYILRIFLKVILGPIGFFQTLKTSLLSPHRIPFFFPPSYFGSEALYKYNPTSEESNYPSLYLI